MLPLACGQSKRAKRPLSCITAPPLLGAAHPMGASGVKPRQRPVFSWGKFQFWSYSRVETSGGIRASLAGRYATALFDLARDQRQIESVGKGLDALSQALLDSRDFAELVSSPIVSREAAAKAFAALAPQLNLDAITANFLGVLARNGRKGELRKIIRAFGRLAAEHRGEATAEVVTSRPLNDDQLAALKQQLRTRAGRDV